MCVPSECYDSPPLHPPANRSFPSKTSQQKAAEAAALADQLEASRVECVNIDKAIEVAEVGRCESEERSGKLDKYRRLKAEIGQLHTRLETLKESDPVEIEKQTKAIEQCREAAHRWVDNIVEVRSYLVKKRSMSSKEATSTLKQFGVQGELDYIQ